MSIISFEKRCVVFFVLLVSAQCLVHNVSCVYGLSILCCPLSSLFCMSLLNVLCIMFPASTDCPFFVAPRAKQRTRGATKNGQSVDAGNIIHKTLSKDKQNKEHGGQQRMDSPRTVHSLLPLVFFVLLVSAQCLVYNVSCVYGLSIRCCPLCSMLCLSLLNVLCILFSASTD
jgi:hypothetical protein